MLEIFANNNQPDQAVPFHQINSKDFEKSVNTAIEMARGRVSEIENLNDVNFDNCILALELASKELDSVTSVFFNLYHACTNPDIDKQVGPISEKLAQFGNDIQLSEKVFTQVKKAWEIIDKSQLNKEQLKLLEETYKGFTRNGALLSNSDKEKLREIDQKLASLGPQYSQNLLKATNSFSLNIKDEATISDLPKSVIATAKEEATKKNEDGWTFTLQAPSFMPFMKYMNDRELREKMWKAYSSRALDGELSNREICKQIAQLRNSRAQLLGYKNHADFVLEKRMAKQVSTVESFLEELKTPSMTAAQKDLKELKEFMKSQENVEFEIMPWDFSFYSEKLKQHRYNLSDEELRPYFPLEKAIEGIFVHGEKLYGLKFEKSNDISTYHEDVEVYRVTRNQEHIGLLYLDIFPRENKKAGAWMTNYREQGFDGNEVKRPHVSIVCNFSKPTKDTPSLLTFYEVQTLFHEFGHSLHSLLSSCYYQSLAGTNVLWDFVELPSQLMENWTYEKESLDLFAKHYQTGESIPEELIDKLWAARNFQAGYSSLRQISFSLVDFAWHGDIENKDLDPEAVEKVALKDVQLLPKIPGTNFSVGFSHIFAGGYSAGYYSYKWAEVLDADAFEAFKEKGLFNQEVATKFYDEVLSKGGTDDPATLYRNFRGKEPDSKALLRRSGLS